jgi:hypothetical protein
MQLASKQMSGATERKQLESKGIRKATERMQETAKRM